MASVEVTHRTSASPQVCWDLMADFANIDFFNPHLDRSHLLPGSPSRGIGTLRQCDLKGGRGHFRERVVAWNEGESYTVDIYEGTLPVDGTVTTLGLTPEGAGARLYMRTTYQPRHGLLGQVMDRLVLRRMFGSMLRGVLVGLAEKAEARACRSEAA